MGKQEINTRTSYIVQRDTTDRLGIVKRTSIFPPECICEQDLQYRKEYNIP